MSNKIWTISNISKVYNKVWPISNINIYLWLPKQKSLYQTQKSILYIYYLYLSNFVQYISISIKLFQIYIYLYQTWLWHICGLYTALKTRVITKSEICFKYNKIFPKTMRNSLENHTVQHCCLHWLLWHFLQVYFR